MASETEFKFQIPSDHFAAVDTEVRSGDAEQLELHATYFDTPEGALASKGVVLRLRQEGDQWVQTAKAKSSGPLERLEFSTELGSLPKMPPPDLASYKGTRIGDLLGGLVDDAAAQLTPTFSTRISRTRRIVVEGASKVELSLDVGSVSLLREAGPHANSPVCELELELVEGRVTDLARLAKDWLARHELSLSSVSKVARGERLLAGNPKDVAVKASAVEYPKGHARLEGDEVQRRILSACLSQILPNATEVASGSVDRDVVHQLRVGLRRLRTALRELDDLHPGQFKPEWEEPLKQAFDALGKSRDRELLETKTQPSLENKGGPRVDLGKKIAGAPLDEAVKEGTFQSVLIDLLAFCSPDTSVNGQDYKTDCAVTVSEQLAVRHKQTLKILGKKLNALHKKVVNGGEGFESLPAEDQHRIRKQLKRLRYLTEFVGPLFRRKAAARYIGHLTPAQDALGEFNDQHVALATYRNRVAQDPKAWYAVGWLSAAQEYDARACRAAIGEIAHANRFWASK